jgi:alkylation response protein AidB-like acyl-CoA dehydrogenase
MGAALAVTAMAVSVGLTASAIMSRSTVARRRALPTFSMERTGVTGMALGIMQQCLEVSVDYASGSSSSSS